MKGYFTTPPVQRNEYKSTLIDIEKLKADILIEAIDDVYTIWSNVELKTSRSIKHVGGKIYEVTERAMDSLKTKYSIRCNF